MTQDTKSGVYEPEAAKPEAAKPELSKGREAGQNSLISTVLGGLIAWVFYCLIVAVPQYHFFIALMLFTTLIFGMNIFPGSQPRSIMALRSRPCWFW